ncbi:AraC family transcriptional regulator [Paenibacillus sp. JNUCC31]|uniref:AraC family transcriptional regulator n=1 Tax=Paenibacillus sp. JNUCC-31 TaxID=2777983 RepID=UPI0017817915|nr:AraC family transcriptional regulator [Paenibacillus sp. JNUCC-31]QOS81054.1 AraC family transcriptional regulator [Paenibacillus sp. JNUCC-31]
MPIITEDQFNLAYRRTSTTAFREVFHAHSQIEITYIHDGHGQLITEGQAFHLEPGTLMIFRPFQLHQVQIQVTKEHPFIRSVLMYEQHLLNPHSRQFAVSNRFMLDLLGQASPLQPIRLPAASPLVRIIEQYASILPTLLPHEAEEDTRLFLLALLAQLRYLWKDRHYSSSNTLPTSSPVLHPHAETVMQWIEEHYNEAFRLEDIADTLHLSPYHLSHIFKKATATTIIAYAQATRIRHACVLLTSTTHSVPEIGHRVGMPSPSYFCKVFRNATGTTPHQYRLNVQGKG